MVNADSSVLFFILAALFARHGEGSCGFELRPSSVSLLTLPGGGSCGVELCPSSVSESITKPLRDEEAAILLCFLFLAIGSPQSKWHMERQPFFLH